MFPTPVAMPAQTVKVKENPTPHINWNVNLNNPVFDTEEEKVKHLGGGTSPENRLSAYWTHPVRFLPLFGDPDLYRTVMIDYIPTGTTLKAVLAKVRGGSLELVQYVESIGQSNFMTARIVFHEESCARSFYLLTQLDDFNIAGAKIRAWQVLCPTYPKNWKAVQSYYENQYSRVLIISNAGEDGIRRVQRKLAYQIHTNQIVDIDESQDGGIMVEFTSVAEAVRVAEAFSMDRDLRGNIIEFEQDYCNDRY